MENTKMDLYESYLNRAKKYLVEDEEDYRDNDWRTQASLTDDCAEWCADKEEYENRYRHGQHSVPLILRAVVLRDGEL